MRTKMDSDGFSGEIYILGAAVYFKVISKILTCQFDPPYRLESYG
ncbi:hypothetical protein [Bdellovibrio sp. HCB2-146]